MCACVCARKDVRVSVPVRACVCVCFFVPTTIYRPCVFLLTKRYMEKRAKSDEREHLKVKQTDKVDDNGRQ